MSTDAQEYVVEMTRELFRDVVDNADDVCVDFRPDEAGGVCVVKVHPKDYGQAIGREGRIADSVRTLVRAAGKRVGAGRVQVRLEEVQ